MGGSSSERRTGSSRAGYAPAEVQSSRRRYTPFPCAKPANAAPPGPTTPPQPDRRRRRTKGTGSAEASGCAPAGRALSERRPHPRARPLRRRRIAAAAGREGPGSAEASGCAPTRRALSERRPHPGPDHSAAAGSPPPPKRDRVGRSEQPDRRHRKGRPGNACGSPSRSR